MVNLQSIFEHVAQMPESRRHLRKHGKEKMKYDFDSVSRRAFVAAAAIGLAGCASSTSEDSGSTSGSTSTSTEASADSSDTTVLNINIGSEPDYLDPALNSSVDGGVLCVNSFVGLYTFDENEELIPAIAASDPEVSDDGTIYTIALNETLWSDGTALTANDFVYSWERAAADETAADYAYLFDIVARNDDGSLAVSADDDYTLTVTLTNPCPYFMSLLAFPTFFPVPQASVEEADPEGTNPSAWCQEAGFICNGAYVLESWEHDESMIYVKNENFYDAENVTIDELDFMLSADNTATFAAYQSGDLDFLDSLPTDEIESVENDADFHTVEQLGTYYVAFNVNADLFSSFTVQQACDFRKAICLLINRQYIVDTVTQTGQQVADSFICPGMSDGNGGEFKTDEISYYDASEDAMADNQAEAKELLEGCGYTFTDNGDGTYSCEPTISLPYIMNDDSTQQGIAECMQQDLAVLGIEMTIETLDWNVFLEERKDENHTFSREGWTADFDDPINMLEIFRSDSGNNDPRLGMEDNDFAPEWDEYDALIEDIRTTTDFAERVDLMHEAEDMLMATWAVIPVYYGNDVFMMKENVTGVITTTTGMKYFMYATKE